MERDQILRDDFPASRKGWERVAVAEHLEAVAAAYDELEQRTDDPSASTSPKLSATAGEQIGRVIAAGEQLAAEIERAAREEAEQIVGTARADSEAIRAAAESDAAGERERVRSESDGILGQLREAVARTVDEAEEAQRRVSDLANQLDNGSGTGTDRSKTRVPDNPAPVAPLPVSSEPDPAQEPVAGATPPEPVLDAATEPADPIEESEPEPATPIAEPEPELETKPAAAEAAAPSATDQEAAARLVAMNLALEGAEAEQIKADLAVDFDGVEDLDALVADVLARSGR